MIWGDQSIVFREHSPAARVHTGRRTMYAMMGAGAFWLLWCGSTTCGPPVENLRSPKNDLRTGIFKPTGAAPTKGD